MAKTREGRRSAARPSFYASILRDVGQSGVTPGEPAPEVVPAVPGLPEIHRLSHEVAVLIAFHNEAEGPMRLHIDRTKAPVAVPACWHPAVREMIWPTLSGPEQVALVGLRTQWRLAAQTRAAVDAKLNDLQARAERGEFETLDDLAQAFTGREAAA